MNSKTPKQGEACERITQVFAIADAAEQLVAKMDEVHEYANKNSVWHFIYGHNYKGPRYEKEFDALKEALK